MFNNHGKGRKIFFALVLSLGVFMAGGFFSLTASAATDTSLPVSDFSITYAQAKESEEGTLVPSVSTAVEGTNVFDDANSLYKLPQKGSVALGGQKVGYKNFVLKMFYNPGMVNKWSTDRLWFRVWEHPSWGGYCLDFTQTETGVNQVSIKKSSGDGSKNHTIVATAVDVPADDDGMLDIKLVSQEAKAALFINDMRVLSTEDLVVGTIGHFQFEVWDSKPIIGFPVTLTTTVEDRDFLTKEEIEELEKQDADFLYEAGHFKVGYETMQPNDVDGTAETEKTVMDFSGVTKIVADADAKCEFRQASADNEKIVYFGSDFSKSPAETAAWTDFTMTTKIKMDYGHNDWSWGKIMFRAQDLRTGTDYDRIPSDGAQNNSYLFNMKNNMVWLSKRTENKEIALSAASYPFLKGNYYDVKITAVGSKLSVFIDDEKIMTVNDDSFSSGVFAFCTWQSAYSVKNIEIINFVSEEDKNAALVKKCADLDVTGENFSLKDWYMTANQLKIVTVDGTRLLRSTVAEGETIALFGDASLGNLWLTANIRALDSGNQGWLLNLMFRSNGWLVDTYYVEMSASGLKLIRDDLQAKSTIGAYGKQLERGRDYKIDITAKEGTINVYLDDTLVIKGQDTAYGTHPNGKVEFGPAGIASWNTGYEVRQLSLAEYDGTQEVGNGTDDIDVSDPVLELTFAENVVAGDEVEVTYRASDDKTATENLTIKITVTKDGKVIRVNGGKFIAGEAGEYIVKVKVTDGAGRSVEKTKTVTASEKPHDSTSEESNAGGTSVNNGCGSVVGGGMAAVVLLCGAAICISKKKH